MKAPQSAPSRALNYATSPLLASKTPPWRSRFVVVLLALAFLVLLGRALFVQVLEADFFVAQGAKRHVHELPLPASRGRILDRHGVVLAASVQVPSVVANPREFQADVAQRKALLQMPTAELEQRTDGRAAFAWLRRQVDDATWQQVQALGVEGVYRVNEFRRVYPDGDAAAHIVGFTGIDGTGQEGVELALQAQLQGQDGSRRVVRDRLGRIVEDVGSHVEPQHGRDVTLSIDSKVQFFAWQRLRDAVEQHGAKAGSAVVLDARSGEILALANVPSPARR